MNGRFCSSERRCTCDDHAHGLKLVSCKDTVSTGASAAAGAIEDGFMTIGRDRSCGRSNSVVAQRGGRLDEVGAPILVELYEEAFDLAPVGDFDFEELHGFGGCFRLIPSLSKSCGLRRGFLCSCSWDGYLWCKCRGGTLIECC